MSLKHGKLPSSAIADLFENLSFLIDVGHPLESAVELLAGSKGGRGDRSADGISAAATLLLPTLRDGTSLGAALASQQEHFGAVAGQVEAADEAGKLSEALVRIAEQQRNSADVKNRILGAMAMPCFLFGGLIIMCLFVFVGIFPDMIENLNSSGGMELPVITQVMMAGSDFIIEYWAFLLGGISLFIVVAIALIRGPLKQTMHRVYANMPKVGMVVRSAALLSFYDTLAYMMFANQPMDKSLEIASRDISNLYIRRMASDAADYYHYTGSALGESLLKIEVMPEMDRLTLVAGYTANKFVVVLDMLAKNKRKELDKALNAMIEWMTPVATIIIAIMTALVGLAIYIPIFSMGTTI